MTIKIKIVDSYGQPDVMGLKQTALRTGYSISHISRVFRGMRNPSLECARKLSTVLGVTMDEFYELLKSGKLANRKRRW